TPSWPDPARCTRDLPAPPPRLCPRLPPPPPPFPPRPDGCGETGVGRDRAHRGGPVSAVVVDRITCWHVLARAGTCWVGSSQKGGHRGEWNAGAGGLRACRRGPVGDRSVRGAPSLHHG